LRPFRRWAGQDGVSHSQPDDRELIRSLLAAPVEGGLATSYREVAHDWTADDLVEAVLHLRKRALEAAKDKAASDAARRMKA
jgi:hypothetical protein